MKTILLVLVPLVWLFILTGPVHAAGYFETIEFPIGGPEAYVPAFSVQVAFGYSSGSSGISMVVNRTYIIPSETAKWIPSFSSASFQTDTVNIYDIYITAKFPEPGVNQTVTFRIQSGGQIIPDKTIRIVAAFVTIHMRIQTLEKPNYPSAQEVANAVRQAEAADHKGLSTDIGKLSDTLNGTLQNFAILLAVLFLAVTYFAVEKIRGSYDG